MNLSDEEPPQAEDDAHASERRWASEKDGARSRNGESGAGRRLSEQGNGATREGRGLSAPGNGVGWRGEAPFRAGERRIRARDLPFPAGDRFAGAWRPVVDPPSSSDQHRPEHPGMQAGERIADARVTLSYEIPDFAGVSRSILAVGGPPGW